MGKQAAEGVHKHLFKPFCLLSPHRKGCRFGLSGAWGNFISLDVRGPGIAPDIGILYDDTFLALTHPSPSIQWYTQLLAVRDSLYSPWINNPRTHTRLCTLIVVLLCNIPGIIDLRFLSLGDGASRKKTTQLSVAFPTAWMGIHWTAVQGTTPSPHHTRLGNPQASIARGYWLIEPSAPLGLPHASRPHPPRRTHYRKEGGCTLQHDGDLGRMVGARKGTSASL